MFFTNNFPVSPLHDRNGDPDTTRKRSSLNLFDLTLRWLKKYSEGLIKPFKRSLEAYSVPSQASKMEYFAKIVTGNC